jgi:hypothetical protein
VTKNNKILLGIASIIPVIGFMIGMGTYVSFIFSIIESSSNGGQPPFSDDPTEFLKSIIPAFAAIGISSIVGIALFVYFIIAAIKDKSASESDKVLWVLLLVFLSYLVFPIYWFVRIWSNDDFSMEKVPASELDEIAS